MMTYSLQSKNERRSACKCSHECCNQWRKSEYKITTHFSEAPESKENIKGKPFVEPAGKLLDKILQAGNFDPEKDEHTCFLLIWIETGMVRFVMSHQLQY